jgi:hypothetical protein
MIIVKLKGGLGNQLFQYAVGRSLAVKNNCDLKFDISDYLKSKDRKYRLGAFNIAGSIVKNDELKYFKKFGEGRSTFRFFNGIAPFLKKRYLKEKNSNFDKKILLLPNNVYLNGYWNSEKYFKDIKKIIKQEISLNKKTSENFNQISSLIEKTNSVSVHIRRGDYLTNKLSKVFSLCSVDYYNKAIKKLLEHTNDPHFFIFSDDIKWTKKNINLNFPIHYVSEIKLEDYEELILMSKCKHNIIANSTFSWWGAWLNNNPDKIIITPQKWFKNETKNIFDIVPKTWLKI